MPCLRHVRSSSSYLHLEFARRRGDWRTPTGLAVLCTDQSIMQNNVEQRLMNPNAAVIFNEAQRAESIHKEADS